MTKIIDRKNADFSLALLRQNIQLTYLLQHIRL